MKKQPLDRLGSLIKSKVALDAIQHVIDRALQFNKDYFPVKIKLIGIGGSSIRDPKPRDIDIVVEIEKVKDRWKDWMEFIKILNKNNWRLYNMTIELNMEGGRANMDMIIERNKEKLFELGFSKKWIEKWLRWVRITDIKWGVDRGLPIVYFSEKKLVSKFLKNDWKRKRMEIHVDYEATDISFIPVWGANEGILFLNKKEIDKFLQKEYEELSNLSNKLMELIKSKKEGFFDIPPIYNKTLYLVIQGSKRDKIFRNTKKTLRKMALSRIKEVKKLLEKDHSVETNSNLREALKQFYLIGLIYEKITNDIFKLSEIFREGENFAETLSGKIRISGFSKKDICKIIEEINAPLFKDIEEYLRRR